MRELLEGLTRPEVAYLRNAPCPVLATANRITRAITTRARARGWRAPAPIVGQVYDKLSHGMESYNSCMKTKEIPMPFAYVQFNALLLTLFNVLAPISIGCFASPSVADDPASVVAIIFSVITAMIVAAGFTAMWLVANELEDPFGVDDNDLPMLEYHRQFDAAIHKLLHWLPMDTWAVSDGKWEVPAVDRNLETANSRWDPVLDGLLGEGAEGDVEGPLGPGRRYVESDVGAPSAAVTSAVPEGESRSMPSIMSAAARSTGKRRDTGITPAMRAAMAAAAERTSSSGARYSSRLAALPSWLTRAGRGSRVDPARGSDGRTSPSPDGRASPSPSDGRRSLSRPGALPAVGEGAEAEERSRSPGKTVRLPPVRPGGANGAESPSPTHEETE